MIFRFAFTEYEIKWVCFHGLWLCASGFQDKYPLCMTFEFAKAECENHTMRQFDISMIHLSLCLNYSLQRELSILFARKQIHTLLEKEIIHSNLVLKNSYHLLWCYSWAATFHIQDVLCIGRWEMTAEIYFTRNRFLDVLQYIHPADNNNLDTNYNLQRYKRFSKS